MAGTCHFRGAAVVALILSMALAACGGGEDQPKLSGPPSTNTNGGDGGREVPTGDGRGGIRLEEIGKFKQPLYVTQPPGERGYVVVVEQAGRVMRVPSGSGKPQVMLDIRDDVLSPDDGGGQEQGLLSVAFAPDFVRSRLMYVDYTNGDGNTRVVEYRIDESDVADPKSAREVLAVEQPYENHNGGLLLFGPDDLLYVGLGDGGSAGDPDRNGQSLETLLGKILRIDPRPDAGHAYTVPRSNPFVGEPDARPEIYSYGLRNPWRFSFDSADHSMWIGDVGQDAFEEVDGVTRKEAAGANYGWSAYEGDARFNNDQSAPGMVPPVLTYALDENCAVTGGYVVRDPDLRTLYGRYLYGDYCLGELRSFTATPGRPASDDRELGVEVAGLSSFGEDNAGHVYATSLGGPVYRLAPTDG